MIRTVIGLTLLMLCVTACSNGYSKKEVEATANAAYRAGHEAGEVAGSSPERVFLEVIKLEAWDGTGGQCPSLISLEGCVDMCNGQMALDPLVLFMSTKSQIVG